MKTILIVEDENSLLEAAKEKLQEKGFNTLPCSTIDAALNILEKGTEIDAVWLDHYLPEKTGIELVIYMKKTNLKYAKTPIFLVSNSSSAERVFQYLELGVNKYFAKAESKIEDIAEEIEKVINDSK